MDGIRHPEATCKHQAPPSGAAHDGGNQSQREAYRKSSILSGIPQPHRHTLVVLASGHTLVEDPKLLFPTPLDGTFCIVEKNRHSCVVYPSLPSPPQAPSASNECANTAASSNAPAWKRVSIKSNPASVKVTRKASSAN